MKTSYNFIASIGLVIGLVFGITGGMLKDPHWQGISYEISSLGLIYASAMLCILYFRKGADLVAAGWLLFAIGEAAMSTGTAGGQPYSQPMFASGMGIYIPALIMISIPSEYPIWARIAGIISAILFAISAGMIFSGNEVLSTHPLPTSGYSVMTIAMIGYIWRLLKKETTR